jgi:hypothetical protein
LWTGSHVDRRDRYDYAVFERAGDHVPSAGLFLIKNAGRLELANIVPRSTHSLDVDEYNFIAEEFATAARPIAQHLNLGFSEEGPYSDITRWLSTRAASALKSFSKLANKSTGTGHPLDFKRWAQFVVYSHKDGQTIPTDLLQQYLVHEELWEEDKAYDLALKYEYGLNILKQNDALSLE